MAKAKSTVKKWLNSIEGAYAKLWPEEARSQPKSDRSIMERLEGIVPDVELIRTNYKVDQRIAKALRKAMLAVEELMKETLREQQQAMEVQDLQMEQQEITGDIIELQFHKQLDVETIVNNLREWLLGDDKTIGWMLEHVLIPAWASGFASQTPARQRKLFNGLRVAANALQKLDGILLEPGEQT